MKLKRKETIIIGISSILAIATVSWAWFTEPVTVDSTMQGREVTDTAISCKSITKDGTAARTIYTQNAAEIEKVVNLMNQYPYSRRLFEGSPASQSHYTDRNMVWVSLGYTNESDEPGICQYIIYEDGYMQTSDFGGHLHSSGIGRFGNQKTKALYSKITDLFQRTEGNPTWERIKGP